MSGKVYHVSGYLGAGLTGQVYAATDETSGERVALKVLRDGAGRAIEENFWSEGETLRELAEAARELG
ncbi:MAG TPA: hypothetical protein VF707_17895, partial [Ardenticatenaceae bacterium]